MLLTLSCAYEQPVLLTKPRAHAQFMFGFQLARMSGYSVSMRLETHSGRSGTVHVRDVFRALHVRRVPDWVRSVCFATHDSSHDGLLRRCVAHRLSENRRSSCSDVQRIGHVRDGPVCFVSVCVGTQTGIEMNSDDRVSPVRAVFQPVTLFRLTRQMTSSPRALWSHTLKG